MGRKGYPGRTSCTAIGADRLMRYATPEQEAVKNAIGTPKTIVELYWATGLSISYLQPVLRELCSQGYLEQFTDPYDGATRWRKKQNAQPVQGRA